MEKSTIYGTITSAFYGATKFSKDDMYRVSIKIDKANRDKLADDCKEMYASAPDSFIPKWYKDDKAEYINFKSKFDIKTIYEGDKEITSLDGFLKKYGNITGSKVGWLRVLFTRWQSKFTSLRTRTSPTFSTRNSRSKFHVKH